MGFPFVNVPQVFTSYTLAKQKAQTAGLTLDIDQVTMTIKRGGVTWYTSDDLENIHIALDAYAAAKAAKAAP